MPDDQIFNIGEGYLGQYDPYGYTQPSPTAGGITVSSSANLPASVDTATQPTGAGNLYGMATGLPTTTVGGDRSGTDATLIGAPDFASAIKNLLNPQTLGGAAGLAGLAALAGQSSFFNAPITKVGYQGGIPQMTATRTMLPQPTSSSYESQLKSAIDASLAQGFSLDQIKQGAAQKYGIDPAQVQAIAAGTNIPQYRRPGAGGITYFSPVQYSTVAPPPSTDVTAGGTTGDTTGGISALPTAKPLAVTQPKVSYSPYQIAQGVYDVLNPAGGGTGTLAEAQAAAAKLGITPQQFEAAVLPRLATALQEARAQMPTATLDQIREAAQRRYGIDAGIFNKAAAVAQPTNEQIKQQIQANINKPQEVAYLANTYGLDTKELADITGKTDNQVRSYFAENNVPLPSENTTIDKYSDEQVAQAIKESMAQGFSLDQTKWGAANKYGISQEQLDRVLGKGAAAGGYMTGGVASLAQGRFLRGGGDGVSDSIPARFAGSGQEARLADNEFVIPARIVSEIGNGSSEAGARRLYAMIDRVQNARKKSIGKNKVAVDSKAYKALDAL